MGNEKKTEEKKVHILLDPEQTAAVESRTNAVITAGAGSGKTTVLAERFASLVKQGVGVDKILSLTFTRKAAGEMHSRIYRRLLEENHMPEVARELERFSEANISTLDSFCAQIVRNASARYGVTPAFSLDEEGLDELLTNECLSFMLEKHDNPVLARFVSSNSFQSVWYSCFVKLAKELFLLGKELDFTEVYEQQRAYLLREAKKLKEELLLLVERAEALDPAASSSIKNFLELAPILLTAFWVRESASESSESRWRALVDCLSEFPKVRKPPSNSRKADAHAFREIIEIFNEKKEALIEIGLSLSQSEELRELFRLCGELRERIINAKRRTGILSFADLVETAVDILQKDGELRRHYKERFSYIMIDEFQDNNRLQKELLYLLAEKPEISGGALALPSELSPDRLFFVGDDKQSIYRFRGADVSVFKGLSEDLRIGKEKAVVLASNYRSEVRLIRFFNKLFEELMSDAAEDYEAVFSPLKAIEREKPIESLIRVLYKPYNKEASEENLANDDAEAYSIARFIAETVEAQSLQVREYGILRPAEYRDFAVLMRSTGNQIRFERMFRLFAVPYITQNVRSLFLEAPVNDIYNLLQLSVYPADRIAYAGLLRSPLVNISDSAFVKILAQKERAFGENEEVLSSVSPEDQEKYCLAKEMYREIRDMADKASNHELIFHIWFRYGYRYLLLQNPSSHSYLEYFNYFYQMALNCGTISLAEFLDHFRDQLGRYEKMNDLDLIHDQTAGVQLLTIHKAKGLEFPILILANAGNRGKSGGEGSAPLYLSDKFGLSFNFGYRDLSGNRNKRNRQNYFYRIAKEEEEKKELAEAKRLLYVALTRAEQHLIISGVYNSRNKEKDDHHLSMVMDSITDQRDGELILKPEYKGLVELDTISDIPESKLEQHRIRGRRLEPSSVFHNLQKLALVSRKAISRQISATEMNRFYIECSQGSWKADQAEEELEEGRVPIKSESGKEAAFGTLVHYVMEKGLSQRDFDIAKLQIPYSKRSEIEEKELSAFLSESQTYLEAFRKTEFGLAFNNAKERETELPFLLRLETEAGYLDLSGQMDCYFVNEGRVIVIDFKTDQQCRPDYYEVQMAVYRRAARELRGLECDSHLLYLRQMQFVKMEGGPSLEEIGTRYLRSFESA